jgi:RNA polymerase sigma-70 factor (ECF subfamily)
MSTAFLRRLTLGRSVAGDRPRRLAEVYERNVDYVYRCLVGLGLDEAAAEDAVQDVFLVVHGKLDAFEERTARSMRTWLYAIALRISRKHRAGRWRETLGQTEDASECSRRAPSEQRGPEARAHDRHLLRLLNEALEGIEPAQREVFVLAELEQCTAPEIAEITGAPVNTVYSRLRLARRKVKERLADHDRQGGERG